VGVGRLRNELERRDLVFDGSGDRRGVDAPVLTVTEPGTRD
jgi:hypothetical protein